MACFIPFRGGIRLLNTQHYLGLHANDANRGREVNDHLGWNEALIQPPQAT